jgi:hypothetical protein
MKPDQRFMRGAMKDAMKTLLPGFPTEEEQEEEKEKEVRIQDVEEYSQIDAEEVSAAQAEDARKKEEDRLWILLKHGFPDRTYYDLAPGRTEDQHAKAAEAEEAQKQEKERLWTIIEHDVIENDFRDVAYYDPALDRTQGQHAKAFMHIDSVVGESKVEQEIAPDSHEIIAETHKGLDRRRSMKRVMDEEAQEKMQKRRKLKQVRFADIAERM